MRNLADPERLSGPADISGLRRLSGLVGPSGARRQADRGGLSVPAWLPVRCG